VTQVLLVCASTANEEVRSGGATERLQSSVLLQDSGQWRQLLLSGVDVTAR